MISHCLLGHLNRLFSHPFGKQAYHSELSAVANHEWSSYEQLAKSFRGNQYQESAG